MRDNHHIDKLFNQKLEHHEIEAPESSWDAIERSLPAKRKSFLLFPWGRVASVGIILLIAGSIGYNFLRDNKSQETTLIKQKNHQPFFPERKTTVQTRTSKSESGQIKSPKNVFTYAVRTVQQPLKSTTARSITNSEKEQPLESGKDSFAASLTGISNDSELKSNETTENIRTATKSEMEEFLNSGKDQESTVSHNIKKSHNKSSVGLLAAFIGPAENSTKEEYSSFRSTSKTDKIYTMLNAAEFSAENNATSVRHSLPITIGLSVEKEIGNKFSLQTGVYGSYLRSTQNQSASLYFTDEIQELYYLGLPLNIAYRFAESERFAFYMKAGGMVEKNIGGRWRERIRRNGEVIYSKLERDLENKLQWSINIGGGVNYNLAGCTNLFIEPSLSYYFDNNSNIENIHKQQKLDITLQAGLRAVFESH